MPAWPSWAELRSSLCPPIKGYLKRTLPHAHPEGESLPGADSWFYCKEVVYRGHVPRNTEEPGRPGHVDALLRATYEGMPYELLEDSEMAGSTVAEGGGIALPVDEGLLKRYISHTSRNRTRVLHAAGTTWTFEGTARPVTSPTFIEVHDVEHLITWHQVPYANIPWASIRATLNKYNDAALGRWPVQTIIFADFGIKLIRLTDGTRAADVTYTLLEKPYGVNHFPDPDNAWTFTRVVARADGTTTPYRPANLKTLFVPLP